MREIFGFRLIAGLFLEGKSFLNGAGDLSFTIFLVHLAKTIHSALNWCEIACRYASRLIGGKMRYLMKHAGLWTACIWTLMASAALAQTQAFQAPTSRALDADAVRMGPSMVDMSATQLATEIRRSPLFVAELDSAALIGGGRVAIELEPGVELDLQQYITGTRLANRPLLTTVSAQPALLDLAGPVSFTEDVFVMTDRIIVSREAVIPVSAETCGYRPRRNRLGGRQRPGRAVRADSANVTAARAELCLMAGDRSLDDLAADAGGRPVLVDPSQAMTPELERRSRQLGSDLNLMLPPTREDVIAEAELIRAELAAMDPDALFRRGVRVRDALALGDGALILLDANGDERVITHVSIIPLAPRSDRIRQIDPQVDGLSLGRGFALDHPIGREFRDLPAVLTPYVTRRASLRHAPDTRVVPPTGILRLPAAQNDDPPPTRRADEQYGIQSPNLPDRRVIGRLPGTEPTPSTGTRRQRITQSDDFYFITGFTLSDRIEERYKHVFNRRRNFYVAFAYSIEYRAGIRFPFRVEVESDAWFTQDPETRVWHGNDFYFNVNAEGRQDTVDGGSIYRAAGMPESLIYDDREFTFGVRAGCQLQLRVPIVKTVRINCPSVDVPRTGTCPNWACADFAPPVGGRRLIAEPRLPADVTGLQIRAWIARAGIEPGVNIYVANPEFSLRASVEDGQFSRPGGGASFGCTSQQRGDPRISNQRLANGDCRLVFDQRYNSERPMNLRLNLDVPEGSRYPGVTLSDPEYRFTMEFVPVLELFAVIDIAVAKWRFDHDFEIAGLTIRQDMRFGHHEGTRESAEIGLCSPVDVSSPACSRAAGYTFQPIQVDRGGPG